MSEIPSQLPPEGEKIENTYTELYDSAQSSTPEEPVPFDREASDEAIDNVLLEDTARMLATVANNEAKALTFAAMADRGGGREMSGRDIYRAFIGIQGEEPAWPMHDQVLVGYAKHTFEPIGAVVKSEAETKRGPKDRYTVSAYGEKVGLATVGLMLDLSLKHPDSDLYHIFGKTATKSEKQQRAPLTRLQILSTLIEDPAQYKSAVEIARDRNLSAKIVAIQAHELSEAGLVEEISFEEGKSDILVMAADPQEFSQLQLREEAGELTRAILASMQQHLADGSEAIEYESIVADVAARLPQAESDKIRTKLSDQLSYWKTTGIVITQSNFSNDRRSNIRIAQDKVDLVVDLWTNVQGLMEGDEALLEWGQQRAVEIVNDPESVNLLLTKAKAASPFKNRSTPAEFTAKITGVLTDEFVSSHEIVERLEQIGKPVGPDSVRVIIKEMVKSGAVEAQQRGHTNFYRLSTTGAQTPAAPNETSSVSSETNT